MFLWLWFRFVQLMSKRIEGTKVAFNNAMPCTPTMNVPITISPLIIALFQPIYVACPITVC